MAEDMDDMSKSLEEFEKHISCGVCCDKYSNPKILPCGHSFCKQCILLTLNDGKPLRCPECRDEVILSEDDVELLQSGFRSSELIEAYSKLYDTYQRQLSSRDQSSRLCEVHDDVKKLYCFDCMELICRDCALQGHKSHDHKYNSAIAPEMKEQLLKSVDPLVNTQNDFHEAVMDVKKLENLAEAQANLFTKYVTDVFDKLHTILENHKQEILKKSKTNVSRILQNLKELEEELTEASVSIHRTVEDTKEWSLISSNEEVMDMYASLKQQIETDKEKFKYNPSSNRYGTYKLKPEKQKINDVNFKEISEFQAFVESFAKLVDIPVLEDHVVNVSRSSLVVQTNTKNEFSVQSRHPVDNGEWQFELASQQYHTNEFEINRIGSSSYHITYVAPSVPGMYKLSILVNGEKVTSNLTEINVIQINVRKRLL